VQSTYWEDLCSMMSIFNKLESSTRDIPGSGKGAIVDPISQQYDDG